MGLGAVGLVAVTAGSAPAFAAGGPVASSAYSFVAKLEIGIPGADDSRACSGALIRPRVVVTARECLVSTANPDPAASSALPITVRFPGAGPISVVDVRPDVAPGLSLVILARPAPVAAVPLAAGAAVGDALTAAGFGRTKDAWISDQPHAVAFTVQQAGSAGFDLALDAAAETGLCKGDAGAPLARSGAGGALELVAVATAGGQKGCIRETDTSGQASAVSPASLASLPSTTTDRFDQLTFGPADSGLAPVADEGFGTAVAVGDFNKDTYLDVAVGAPKDRTGANRDAASGTVTVFAGSANGPGTGKVLLQSAFGAADEAGDLFGSSLAVGDFNKDGYADLAIGAPGEVVGTIQAGAFAVFSGSATGLATPKGYDLNDLGLVDVAGDQFGKALAAGDFNGDGFADLAVGAPGKSIGTAKSGQVIVLKGSSAGLPKATPWVVDQRATEGANETGDLFGSALAAGNVLGAKTGTVYSDLVVGVPGEAPDADPQSGLVYVIPGSASGPVAGALDFTQTGNGGSNEAGDKLGAAVAVGDFNKDGWSDVAAGIPGELPRTDPQSGSAVVVPGGNTALGKGYPIEERDVTGGANLAGDRYGSAFATGDLNGDGYADLLAAAPGRSAGAGVLYTWLGGAVTTARPNSLTPASIISQSAVYDTDEAGDGFATALAAGDLNKDGKADAVVGVPAESAPGEPNAGRVITLSRAAG